MMKRDCVLKREYREVSAGLTWQAVYPNKVINQYNGDGSQNSYDGLEHEGMTAFNLVNGQGEIVVNVPLGEGRKLFYRMRVALHVHSGVRERVYVLGWQSVGSRQIWIVDSKGKVRMVKNWKKDSQWLYAPQFRLFEQVSGTSG